MKRSERRFFRILALAGLILIFFADRGDASAIDGLFNNFLTDTAWLGIPCGVFAGFFFGYQVARKRWPQFFSAYLIIPLAMLVYGSWLGFGIMVSRLSVNYTALIAGIIGPALSFAAAWYSAKGPVSAHRTRTTLQKPRPGPADSELTPGTGALPMLALLLAAGQVTDILILLIPAARRSLSDAHNVSIFGPMLWIVLAVKVIDAAGLYMLRSGRFATGLRCYVPAGIAVVLFDTFMLAEIRLPFFHVLGTLLNLPRLTIVYLLAELTAYAAVIFYARRHLHYHDLMIRRRANAKKSPGNSQKDGIHGR